MVDTDPARYRRYPDGTRPSPPPLYRAPLVEHLWWLWLTLLITVVGAFITALMLAVFVLRH